MDPAAVSTVALDGSPPSGFFKDFFGRNNCSSTRADCALYKQPSMKETMKTEASDMYIPLIDRL